MAYAYPGQYNTWVPSWEATGQVIAYLRDPKRFPINQYVAFRPAGKRVGLYLEYDLDNPNRSLSLDQMVWASGGERPGGEHNVSGFEFKSYQTIRRDLAVTLGRDVIAQTDWPILAFNASTIMQQAMVALTRLTWNVLDTDANWGVYTSTAVAAGSGAGKFELANATVGDANYLNIKKVFDYGVMQIAINTNQMVVASQVKAVMGLGMAKIIAESAELIDFVKQSPFALGQIMGTIPGRNTRFGLPDTLYGVDLVVEDTYYVSTVKGATVARTAIKNNDKLVFMTKTDALPGDQVGEAPVPNFSTFQVFHYNETLGETPQGTHEGTSGLLVVETWEDVRNKRTEAHVTWDTDQKMVAPSSGWQVTDCTSTY